MRDVVQSLGVSGGAIPRILKFASENCDALAVVNPAGRGDILEYTFDSLVGRIADYGALFELYPPGTRVALLFQQSFEAYAAILAAFHSGIIFCPLDPRLPPERLSYCIQQLQPAIVISGTPLNFDTPKDTVLLTPDQLSKGHSLCSGRDCASAYIIFTSGSTGLPKGIEILSSGVEAFLKWAWSNYSIDPGQRWAQFSSLGFDLSLVDILCCLPQGGTLVPFAADVDRAFPTRLIKQAGVNVWHSVPSVIPLLTEYGTVAADSLADLRVATFCGEPLYPQQAKQLLALNPRLSVFNTYGPTEATLFCSCQPVNEEFLSHYTGSSLPIGKPIPGWAFRFSPDANDNLEELWIVSQYVGKGYIAQTPDQERFGCLPTEGGSERAYRTGDLFFRNSAGDVVFARRNDRQVKVRGNRIDLSEIEYQALNFGALEAKALLSTQGLVLFVSPEEIGCERLREHLAATLPSHAIPSLVISLSRLPRNVNAKVDTPELLRLLQRGS